MDGALAVGDLIGALAWAVAVVLSLVAARRAPRGRRLTWAVVALASAVIVVDNAFEVQLWIVYAVRHTAGFLGVNVRSGPARLWVLGLFFVGACGVLFAIVRANRPLDLPRVVALSGLVAAVAFVGARLGGPLRDVLSRSDVGVGVELTCWALVCGGAIMSRRDSAATGGET